MRIRHEQIQAFEDAGHPAFEDFMIAHLREFAPQHWELIEETGIRGLIRRGVAQAQNFGLTRRGPVKFYIETTILLGIAFDTDPQYPSLGRILRDSTLSDEVEKADRAHAWLMEYLDAVGGPDHQYVMQALHRASQFRLENIPASESQLNDYILQQMEYYHPEKYHYVGAQNLRALVLHARQEARKYLMDTAAGVCVLAGLMYFIGHGVADDPLYPWVNKTLSNPAIKGSDQRVKGLYNKMMTYLEQVMRHLAGQQVGL